MTHAQDQDELLCPQAIPTTLSILTILTILTIPTMSATFYLNRAQDKIQFDRIVIRKSQDKFTANYFSDMTKNTLNTVAPFTLSFDNHHDVLDYMEDILDLLIHDWDNTPFHSMDVMIAGYPIVALKPDMDDSLILRVMRSWCKRD